MGNNKEVFEKCKTLVVFDLNGTLSNDVDAQLKAVNAVLRYLAKDEINLERLRETMAIPPIKFYLANGCTLEELKVHEDKISEIFFKVYNENLLRAKLFKGAIKVLESLKKEKISFIILTNYPLEGNESFIYSFFMNLGLGYYIENLIAISKSEDSFNGSLKVGILKEYLGTSKKFGRVVMIGDGIEEIEIAKELNGGSISLTTGYYSRKKIEEANPNFIINDLEEILDFVL